MIKCTEPLSHTDSRKMKSLLKVALLSISLGQLVSCCPDQCFCDGVTVNCTGLGLTSVPQGIPHDVETLILTNNAIATLDDLIFANFTVLKYLDVSRNELKTIPKESFSGLSSLNTLDLSFNSIVDIASGAFNDLYSLTAIHLAYNYLTLLDHDLFQFSALLNSINLNHNFLNNKVFESFSMSPSLQQLDVSFNPILNLPYIMLSNNNRLAFLQLKHSNISDMDTNTFVGLSSLSNIDLSNNLITNLKREAFQPLTVVNTVNLENNPLQCSCDIKKFQDWLAAQVDDNILEPDVSCDDPILGGNIDVENGNLDHLCYDNATTTTPAPTFFPPGDCDQNAKLRLRMSEGDSETEQIVMWEYELIEDDNVIEIECREFKDDPFLKESFPIDQKSFALDDLQYGENYVCCGLVFSCGVYSCVDFDTGTKDCPNVGFIVGMTLSVIALVALLCVLIGLVIYFIRSGKCGDICDKKQNANISSNNTDMNLPPQSYILASNYPPELPKPRPPPLRKPSGAYYEISPYEPYEVIPADTVDPALKPAFANPGYLQKTPSQRSYEKQNRENQNDVQRKRSNSEPSKHKKKRQQELELERLSMGQYLHQSNTEPRKPRRFVKPKPYVEAPNPNSASTSNIPEISKSNQLSASSSNIPSPGTANHLATSSPNIATISSPNHLATSSPHIATISSPNHLATSSPHIATISSSQPDFINVVDSNGNFPPPPLELPPKKPLTRAKAQIRLMYEQQAKSKHITNV